MTARVKRDLSVSLSSEWNGLGGREKKEAHSILWWAMFALELRIQPLMYDICVIKPNGLERLRDPASHNTCKLKSTL